MIAKNNRMACIHPITIDTATINASSSQNVFGPIPHLTNKYRSNGIDAINQIIPTTIVFATQLLLQNSLAQRPAVDCLISFTDNLNFMVHAFPEFLPRLWNI